MFPTLKKGAVQIEPNGKKGIKNTKMKNILEDKKEYSRTFYFIRFLFKKIFQKVFKKNKKMFFHKKSYLKHKKYNKNVLYLSSLLKTLRK